mmetsp:Transcript_77074/g.135968  ORF Transcript_77074/g.135968 Transcript_77074/m.135968 type:complete len:263 (-) Transcript_77074:493-1281(-)
MITFKSASSGGTVRCFNCSVNGAMNCGTSAATHSRRYLCSSRGISAMALNKAINSSGFTGGSSPSQRSQRFWIHSLSCCRSSCGMRPSEIASGFVAQVGICSCSPRISTFSTITACLLAELRAPLPVPLRRSSAASSFSDTNCVSTPLRCTNSSSGTALVFALISFPKRPSNFWRPSSMALSNGMASSTSKRKLLSLFSFAVQNMMKVPRHENANAKSGQSTSHSSAWMSSGMFARTRGRCLRTPQKMSGFQNSGCVPKKSS